MELQEQVRVLLTKAAANDSALAKDMSRTDKSIEEFTKLFYDAVRKVANGASGNIEVFGSDDELIGAAVHYFHEDDVKELKLESLVVCGAKEKPQPKPQQPKAPTSPKATKAKVEQPTPPQPPTPPTPIPPTAPKVVKMQPKATEPTDGIYDEDFF